MFGCLRKLGCLVVILAAVAGYYWYTHHHTSSPPTASTVGIWSPVTSQDAALGRQTVESLNGPNGRVFANLTPAQAVAYLIQHAAHQFPESAQGIEAMITGDTLHVKTVVSLKDFNDAKVLGPLASLLGDRDTVLLAGRVDMVHAGLAQMHITEVRVHGLKLPSPAIPKLVNELRHTTPAGVAADALPIPLPPYIAEIRIANGKVTLYKNV